MAMSLALGGLHHVTAVTAHAAENVAFYTRMLGLRLVKKTVNQDDVSAYHLFYGDEIGSAGTEVTFFDWARAARHHPGIGEVAAIALQVPDRAALEWWAERFAAHDVAHETIEERADRALLPFTDPEGQRLQLIAGGSNEAGSASGRPWSGSPVPEERQIRGLGAVTLNVRDIGPTARVLTDVLGFRQTGDAAAANGSGRVANFETGPGGLGTEVRVEAQPDLPRAGLGRGGVHHIAFRTASNEEQLHWRERITAAGLDVTPPIDRFYFRSLYFREPGGVLFEIATDGPGFATDEDAAHLGERLALPPFLEPHRARIEAGLRPLDTAVAQTSGDR